MSAGVCESCGDRLAVAPVTYAYGEQRITQQLCARCKDTMLGRRRTRRAPAHRRRRHRRGARLWQALKEGGPLAYVGVGLFVLGLVLVPTLIAISLLTR
jgi:hypothetical protein